MFAWKACLDILPVKANLIKKCIPLTDRCEVCGEGVETVRHCLFQCEFAERVWLAAGLDHLWQLGLTCDFFAWIWRISSSHGSAVLGLVFSMCWGIWLHHNQVIFAKTNSCAGEVASIALNSFSTLSDAQDILPQIASLASLPAWLPPDVGVFMLNYDGAIG